MLPNPLHPAIVHFPVVLAFLLPISAAIAIWTIRKGARASRAWMVPLAVAVALTLSSWLAVETGESQDEKVERVVQEQPLDAHEEAAEAFLTGSVLMLVITAAGMIRGRFGTALRVTAAAGSVALLVGGAYVGHTGGQLVYKYGAAGAYANPQSSGGNLAANSAARDHDD